MRNWKTQNLMMRKMTNSDYCLSLMMMKTTDCCCLRRNSRIHYWSLSLKIDYYSMRMKIGYY